ncbi:syntaxin-2-like isoform X2 [Myripristis murdjan]|nr:syntaxin-2-like isoform X2 [Myripristis murdjan]XP_029921891.1 syntaxin-2-like isoform X2 [Myripristis murdjan]XP_029921892.1 syntaxin-2-like isoform X2 [Myripristis murdjan]XP_029921893.1 syntaxin-2-like isoform X2 [Myripristis murdjan]XP_029921894.1 syntaxin-2-like isoform X2 [Myripristis murdjan]
MENSSTDSLENFFKTVQELSDLIAAVSSAVEEVQRSHDAILAAADLQDGNKDELEKLNSQIKKNANLVRAKLKSMQESFAVDENSNSASVNQRIHKNQHSHLTRRFVDVMRTYCQAQTSFREKCKLRIQRQLEIVDKVTTDEELEDILHSDNPAIFTSHFISDSRITRQALNEIEARHQDILRLESSIRELQEVFVDTAMLVESQGELMNNIEKNVTSAAEYVDSGKADTKNAVDYMKKRHRITPFTGIFNPFRRPSSAKTAADQKPQTLNHDCGQRS